MRLSEALKLTWNDVRLDDGYAYVPDTKNNEPRAIFLPPVAVAALGGLGRDGKPSDRLFRFSKSGHLYPLLKVAAFRGGVDLPERGCGSLYLVEYTGSGATLDQVKAIFAHSGVRVLMHSDFWED